MLTTHGGFIILAVAFVVFVCVIVAVLVHDFQRQIQRLDDEDETMAKAMQYGAPEGGSKPIGPEAAPKGKGGGKTGRGGDNKLPKHALHARGKGRGMGKGCG